MPCAVLGSLWPGTSPAPAFSFSSLCYLATVPSSCGGLLRPAEVIFHMWLFGRRRGAGIRPRPSPELIVRVNSILWKFILRNFDKFIGKLLFSFFSQSSIKYCAIHLETWTLPSCFQNTGLKLLNSLYNLFISKNERTRKLMLQKKFSEGEGINSMLDLGPLHKRVWVLFLVSCDIWYETLMETMCEWNIF